MSITPEDKQIISEAIADGIDGGFWKIVGRFLLSLVIIIVLIVGYSLNASEYLLVYP
jgi:hypothetical protein